MVIPNIKFIVRNIGVAQEQIESLAKELHWELWESTPKTSDTHFEIMWADRATNTSIHYHEDDFIGINYLMVLGENYEKVATHIREHVDVVPRSEVIEFATKAQTDKDLAWAAEGVACTASSIFDKELFTIIERAANSHDKETRYAALTAIGYVEWPECRNLLERIAAHDEDEQNRHNAQKLLETLKDIWEAPPIP